MRPRSHSIVARPASDLSPDLVLSLHARSGRDARGLFLAEGARALTQAVEHGATFAGILICPQRLKGRFLRESVTRVERAGVPLIKVSLGDYRDLSPGVSAAGENSAAGQGVLLVLGQRWNPLPDQLDAHDLWIGLESVRTPGNLGTLLRSGDAAGATGLVIFDRSESGSANGVDPYDPAAVRATMGSLFGQRLMRTTHRLFRRWPLRRGIGVYGGTPEGAMDYRLPNYRGPTMLMLGDERSGLSDGQRGSCDAFVRIPMVGAPDSLNLAMAGTVMLYETLNQRWPLEHSSR